MTTDVWIDVHEERESLLMLLEKLTPVEWDAPSLCTDWRVRDVVGHMCCCNRARLTRAVY